MPRPSDVVAEKGELHVEANEQGGDEEGAGETDGVDEETQIPSLSSWHTVLSWQFSQVGTGQHKENKHTNESQGKVPRHAVPDPQKSFYLTNCFQIPCIARVWFLG